VSNLYKKATEYFKKHQAYNAVVHALGGIGVGVIIASPIAGEHPVRFGLIFLGICLLGHIYAWIS